MLVCGLIGGARRLGLNVGLNSNRNKRRPESLRTRRRLISALVRVGSYTIGMNSHVANPGAEAVTADPTHPPFEVGDLFRDYGPAIVPSTP